VKSALQLRLGIPMWTLGPEFLMGSARARLVGFTSLLSKKHHGIILFRKTKTQHYYYFKKTRAIRRHRHPAILCGRRRIEASPFYSQLLQHLSSYSLGASSSSLAHGCFIHHLYSAELSALHTHTHTKALQESRSHKYICRLRALFGAARAVAAGPTGLGGCGGVSAGRDPARRTRTCPTVCYSDGGSNCPPGTPPQGQGQNKGGGHPSGYYYFFTSGGSGRRAGPSGFALVLVMALAAGFHE
jgi:hypothetical protein